ncbi:MAG: MvdD family ATP-grasp ribosomal peptide maturase [Proteobacteria bacterium]|nr:MvdD family ATP-grasp ribosomal peptide maturase [Pseudomonadota bacterium]
MTVLIITHSNDNESITMVSQAIEKQGGKAVRFNTDRFPGEDRLVLGLGSGVEQCLITDNGTLALDEVTAIWYRRVRIGQSLPQDLDPQLLRPAIEEARRTFMGMMSTLDVFVMDPIPNIRYAENKQLQLQVAKQVGLEIPDTLLTNHSEAVRRFAEANDGKIITKMQTSFAVYQGKSEYVVFTNKMDEDALNDMEGLDLCPMIFQANIEKALELRATIVGDQIFCASIDSSVSEQAEHDWRRDGMGFIKDWQPYELAKDLKTKLLQLMDRLHLNYGAADIILTPDGRYVFLEVNPVGEFYWLDLYTKLPISEGIAQVLMGQAYRRPNNICG